ncbi:MAG TPA: hypothetical protein VFB68_20445 [Xanthobacteraceae bacterium]|nr:hypothetical protein [Xanthobacteraceae bacterium]
MTGGDVDYRDMALSCIREADATDDPVLKKTLLGIANLYDHSARVIEVTKATPHQAAAPANQ